jgi:hypothetical protein
VPVINGRPAWHAALRSGAAGALLTDHLSQLLRLRHPSLPPGLLPDGVVEALKEAHCAVAGDYPAALGDVAARPETAGGRAALRARAGRGRVGWRGRGRVAPHEGVRAPPLRASRQTCVTTQHACFNTCVRTAGGHGVRIQLPLFRPAGPTAEELAAQEARR